ncbi:unnamed protein product [Dimorphilus gyrociliatus]|uniref:Uncharacterized protein n=1 Tax=Dimorphilus gyrociliatus TaxID=2664684 RepID=A0A7I8WDD3_9ANNE|nr:unnamed protein product [Dimorphilus gyrociliatus]
MGNRPPTSMRDQSTDSDGNVERTEEKKNKERHIRFSNKIPYVPPGSVRSSHLAGGEVNLLRTLNGPDKRKEDKKRTEKGNGTGRKESITSSIFRFLGIVNRCLVTNSLTDILSAFVLFSFLYVHSHFDEENEEDDKRKN